MPSPLRKCSDCASHYRAPKAKGCPRCERSLQRDSRKTRPLLTLRAKVAEIEPESLPQIRAHHIAKLMADIERVRKVAGWPVALERRGADFGITDRDGIPRSKRQGRFVAEFVKPNWRDVAAVIYPVEERA